ncbi:DUF4062 domain-containing protein [Oxalicibacterium faecigallinarum]|uniref:DUF4062 domain-containing protein n=1 Tax=Oxalicibacterium faecigallinarum TaxID=573741 RepID=A0A8J3ASA5_9BURK|nr:DUF4062 domain-containing protein [Oxalicibacterium faecigallinarum]GGI15716.1 hypothetical protein GCM10008066_00290 [Oxalicibacterium faecigallinarum]
MDKKYQVFVSSTFSDLEDERAAVLEGILQMGHIPAGMELFHANNSSAWEYITKVIEASDYYVLVLGGRYGSLDEHGMGFTEKEYEYARSLNIPVIALLHEEPTSLPRDRTDQAESWVKLQNFREKVESRHIRVVWNSPTKLKAELILSLSQQIQQKPGRGWVRDVSVNEMTATKLSEDSPVESPKPKAEQSLKEPSADWLLPEYENAVIYGHIHDNAEYISKITDSYLATLQPEDDFARAEWLGLQEYWKYIFDRGASTTTLKRCLQEAPSSHRINFWIGKAYYAYEEFRIAAKHFEAAETLATGVVEKIHYLQQASDAYLRFGDEKAARIALDKARMLVTDDEDDVIAMLNAVRLSSTQQNEDHNFIAATEKLLELNPSNHGLRFELAHKYSDMGKTELAVMHYSRIPSPERSSATWNNLGVALGKLNLPYLAVAALLKAKQLGETLANSNLALRLANAGFIDEATQLCASARETKDFSENIPSTERRLREIPQEEEKEKSIVVDKAKNLSEFYKEFGLAAALPSPALQSGAWKSPQCELSLSVEGYKFVANGEYVTAINKLGIGLFGDTTASSRTDVMIIEGTIKGRTAVGTIKRNPKGSSVANTLLGSVNETSLFILSADGKSIEVLENVESTVFRKFSLHALLAPPTTQ